MPAHLCERRQVLTLGRRNSRVKADEELSLDCVLLAHYQGKLRNLRDNVCRKRTKSLPITCGPLVTIPKKREKVAPSFVIFGETALSQHISKLMAVLSLFFVQSAGVGIVWPFVLFRAFQALPLAPYDHHNSRSQFRQPRLARTLKSNHFDRWRCSETF